jgi:serine/threonine-protein kinase
MLTGKPPFRDAGAQALIHAHLNLFPKPMTELDRALPGVLDRVVLRCLAKQPEQRYETMAEVSRALDAALEPTELGLAYESQPYTDGDATAVGPRGAPPTGAPSPYDDAPWAEDSTTKVARGRTRPAAAPPSGPTEPMPPVPGAPPSVNDFGARDETAVMSRQDAEALRVAGLERAAARECAMCKTLNPPHARACGACGVSLDHEDQAAVRARVTAPRTAHLLAPQMPPPSASAFAPPHGPTGPLEAQAPHGAPGPALQGSQVAPWHGAPQGGGPAPRGPQGSLPGVPFPPGVPYTGSGPRGWGTPPSNPPPAGRPTAWQRFLAWTGLRGR